MERRSISSIYCSDSTSVATYTWSGTGGMNCCCYGWSSLSPKEMTISAFVEESPVDEDDDPEFEGGVTMIH